MSEMKYTKDDLKTMQSWSLERKIQVTQTRIIEWYQYYKGQVCVSFSGGKDSTVLFDLARRIYHDIETVFVDTGLEYPEIREFVKSKENVTWLKPKMNFRKVIETYGYPVGSKNIATVIEAYKRDVPWTKGYIPKEYGGNWIGRDGVKTKSRYSVSKKWMEIGKKIKISPKCCGIMKEKPLKEYQKKNHKRPIVGLMADESVRRETAWLKTGCNAFNSAQPMSKPMSFWTKQDVLEYLHRFNIPYASVYGEIKQDENGKYYTTGCDRTGCIFCGFGCHLEKEPNRFQRLKQTHPKLWEYCMRDWDKGGLGMKQVLEYIGVKYE